MINLFDIMRQAQGGAALTSLSRQFGLNGPQTQLALDALLPAFSLAFQRNAQHPSAFAGVVDLVTSGRFAPFFDGSGGFAQRSPSTGEDVLEALFGSKEVSRQVAAQAAAATGLGVQVLQDMMPVVAATLIGGLFRYASIDGFADLLRTWSDALKAAAPAAAQAPSRPSQASAAFGPWSEWFDLMGRMRPAAPPPPAPPQPSKGLVGDPFQAWGQMMSALTSPNPAAPPSAARPPTARPPTARPPATPPAAAQQNPFAALSEMFESGRDVQAQQLANLQTILDGVWGQRSTG